MTGYNSYKQDRSSTSLPAFQVKWVITQAGDKYHYAYTFTGDGFAYNSKTKTWNGSNPIDHIVVDVGDDCDGGGGQPKPGCVTTAKVNGKTLGSTSISYGDIDGITGGVRLQGVGASGVTYEFDSARAPVWGFLAVSGVIPGSSVTKGCGDAVKGTVGTANVACSAALVAMLRGDAKWGDKPTTWFVAVPDAEPVRSTTNGSSPIPEPGTLVLLGAGLFGVGWSQRRAA
jgi:hypothetical protein